MNLELAAAWWLRHEKKCVIVLNERTPRGICGQPDVLGVTHSRYATEIEIKRTMSDFRADKMKARTRNRDFYKSRFPKQFYYLVPESLCDKCLSELPDWAGLMTCRNGVCAEVVKTSPINRDSRRYSLKECVHLSCLMANQIVAQAHSLDCVYSQFKHGHSPWLPDGVIDYSI